MPRTVNGIGTKWYGKALPASDGSYVVTEWVTLVYLPVIPLGSKRVIWDNGANSENVAKPWYSRSSGTFYRTVKVPMYWPHVFKAYAIVAAIFIGLALSDLLRTPVHH